MVTGPIRALEDLTGDNVILVTFSLRRRRADPWIGLGCDKPRPYIGDSKGGETLAG